jgi:polyhydroxybutyrate depolymerase
MFRIREMTKDRRFKIQVGRWKRRCMVHLPPDYDQRTAVPVVVMLHGGGATSRAAALETGWNQLADRAGFLVVYPDALPRNPTEPSSFPANPQLWNDGSNRYYASPDQPDDLALLDALLDELTDRFAVDQQRVFLTGFSNGASMAFRAGAELSGRIAAIAPVAGTCWLDTIDLQRPVPLCYITGTADPLNPLDGGVARVIFEGSEIIRSKPKPPVRNAIVQWAAANGCPVGASTVREADGVRTEMFGPGHNGTAVVCVTVEGLGHVWPGGRSPLPESVVGKPSDKIKATELIWDFFQQAGSVVSS